MTLGSPPIPDALYALGYPMDNSDRVSELSRRGEDTGGNQSVQRNAYSVKL